MRLLYAKRWLGIGMQTMENLSIYFRRCHICETVIVQNKKIERCQHCQKFLAPFYYFDDQQSVIFSEDQLRPKVKEGQVKSLIGLTVYWS